MAAIGSQADTNGGSADSAYSDISPPVAALPFATVDANPCAATGNCDSTCYCEPLWLISADALFLHRNAAAGYGALYDATSGDQLLNASSLGNDWQTGFRLIAMRRLASDRWLDVEYFGIDGWSSRRSFGPGNLLLIGDESQSGPPATTANFFYGSRLHTVEANLRAADDGWIQPLAGFRWVRLSETYDVSGLWNVGLGPLPYQLNYHTQNDLYGGQIGANAILWDRGGPLRVNVVGKAGVYLGHASNDAGFDGSPIISLQTQSVTDRCSFFGELGLNASWRFNSTWALRGGYQVYWLEGVAMAPNQVLSTDLAGQGGGINGAGGLFLHGAHVGLEATW
ncbi:MAG: hypothetical protein IT427_10250 [Pirellulales bacterium]|nr:hypothetical protein [Pirellulales bacterium]